MIRGNFVTSESPEGSILSGNSLPSGNSQPSGDPQNGVINKDTMFEVSNSNKSSRRNFVDLLSNFWFLDVILHPDKYPHFPSYFQRPSIIPMQAKESILSMIPKDAFISARESILSMIPKDAFIPKDTFIPYREPIFPRIPREPIISIPRDIFIYHVETSSTYDTPFSTMPFLSSDLETKIYVRKEHVRWSILPQLVSEVSENRIEDFWLPNKWRDDLQQWKSLTRTLDVLAANRHPWFGGFFDVVTEFYGPAFRKYELIENYIEEFITLQDLMSHQSRLLEEGGFLNYSDESD